MVSEGEYMDKNKNIFLYRIAVLFVILQCIFFLLFFAKFGNGFEKTFKEKIGIKLYNEILEISLPQAKNDGSTRGLNIYDEIIARIMPAFDFEYQMRNSENQEEDYLSLLEDENKQIEFLLKENDEAQMDNKKEDIGEEIQIEKTEKKYNINKLRDFDYLRKNFYRVDSTTSISKEQLDVDKLLNMDMSIDKKGNLPEILIYHTHSQEGYLKSGNYSEGNTVMEVGDYLEQILEQKYGFNVLHHKGKYDVNDRDHAYSNAEPGLRKVLQDNPSIQVVIDLHRDGVSENTHLVTEVNGKKTAQIMFFNGLSRTTSQGNIASLKNPYIDSILALSFQLELKAQEQFSGLSRKIYLKGYRYNMHMCPKSILVEVGAQNNTIEEALNAMEPLAKILYDVLK